MPKRIVVVLCRGDTPAAIHAAEAAVIERYVPPHTLLHREADTRGVLIQRTQLVNGKLPDEFETVERDLKSPGVLVFRTPD